MKTKNQKSSAAVADQRKAQTEKLDASRIQMTSVSSSYELPRLDRSIVYTIPVKDQRDQ